MSTTETQTEFAETAGRFATQLRRLAPKRREGTEPERPGQREDRAALALLRRAAGKRLSEVDSRTLGLFYNRLAQRSELPGDEEDFFLVATLFPFAPDPAKGSFGESLRRLREASRGLTDEAGNHPLDRQVIALLDADRDELPRHLRQLVLRLDQARLPHGCVDWLRLLRDVRDWDHPDRYVQKRWARDYWSGGPNTETNDPETPQGE